MLVEELKVLVEVLVEVLEDVDVEELVVEDVVVLHVNAASSNENESNSAILCVLGYYNPYGAISKPSFLN